MSGERKVVCAEFLSGPGFYGVTFGVAHRCAGKETLLSLKSTAMLQKRNYLHGGIRHKAVSLRYVN